MKWYPKEELPHIPKGQWFVRVIVRTWDYGDQQVEFTGAWSADLFPYFDIWRYV